jgi:hypothetical protein
MTTVVAPGAAFRALARNQLHGVTLASIAIADRSLFIRTATHLYRVGPLKTDAFLHPVSVGMARTNISCVTYRTVLASHGVAVRLRTACAHPASIYPHESWAKS